MSEFIEICPHCGKVFFQPCENCRHCGGSFDLTVVRERRKKWLSSMKKDGFLTAALKTVAEADFSHVDDNLVHAVLRSGDFEALKKVVLTGFDQWDKPELLMAAIKAPLPEMMAFLTAEGVDFKAFFDKLTAGEYYAVSDVSALPAPTPVDIGTASEKLRKAVDAGDFKKAQYWLRNGGDVNFPTPTAMDGKKNIWYEDTLPMVALVRSVKMAELLVRHGAKLDDMRILPHVTAWSGLNVVRYLVEHGAKYSLSDPKLNLLNDAAMSGSLALFKYLHGLGFDLNKGVDDQGKTPVRIAAEHGNGAVLDYLLENDARTDLGDREFGNFADKINTLDMRDEVCLKCLKVLVKHGIDIRRCELLEYAAFKGAIRTIGYLLDHGCPVENPGVGKGIFDIYPLLDCIRGFGENKLEVVDLLVSHGATVNGIYRYGGSPLRAAVKAVDPALVEKLIASGADVNFNDKERDTLLCEALEQKPKTKVLKIVRLLVENGVDTKKREWANDRSPRSLASYHGLDNVVAYFDERGIK